MNSVQSGGSAKVVLVGGIFHQAKSWDMGDGDIRFFLCLCARAREVREKRLSQ